MHFEDAYELYQTDEALEWRDRAAMRGWTTPAWPSQYGGGGLSREQHQVLAEEMARIKAIPPAGYGAGHDWADYFGNGYRRTATAAYSTHR